MSVLRYLILSLLPLLACAAPTYIGITGVRPVGAGRDGKVGKTYSEDFTVCPKDYPSGLSLECVTVGNVKSVDITFNGRDRTERVKPYFAGGDRNGDVFALKSLPDMSDIVCDPMEGDTLTLKVTFKCGEDKEDTEERDMEEAEKEEPKMEEPKMEEPKMEEPKMEEDKKEEPEMEEPKMDAPEPEPKKEESESEPVVGEEQTEEKSSGDDQCVGAEKDGRIIMDAKNVGVVGGWVLKDDGIEYKPNGGEGIEKPFTDVLEYEFEAGTDSKYLLTYEVTAPHPTEHNDAYLGFPKGGLTAAKPGDLRQLDEDKMFKGYNNAAKRAVGAFHVDHDPHTLITTATLKKGEKYTIPLGARSTKFTVHNIILFPCSGDECFRGSNVYKENTKDISTTGCV